MGRIQSYVINRKGENESTLKDKKKTQPKHPDFSSILSNSISSLEYNSQKSI